MRDVEAAAATHMAAADERLQRLGGTPLGVNEAWIRRQLELPAALDPAWSPPSAPVPVAGGAVHADVLPTDRPTFDALRSSDHAADPETLAAVAQAMRLPVTPYRSEPSPPAVDVVPGDLVAVPGDLDTGHRVDLEAVRVVDLTAMWAGPLTTALLASVGASVIKVDPACRPDGFRTRPRLYRALNGSKTIVDLDLRREADRERFERLVADADLVVESFSRRVMSNLGNSPDDLRRVNPRIATLAIRAFPAGSAEQDWVAYGAGVHAASGLGMVEGRPEQPAVAYPDPLTGLRAFAVALGLLGRSAPTPHVEVSLLGSLEPLTLAPS